MYISTNEVIVSFSKRIALVLTAGLIALGMVFAPLAANAKTFKDVSTKTPFHNEISRLADLKVTSGYGDGKYRPNSSVRRDHMIAFIYRASGTPSYKAPSKSPFTDIKPSNPYYKEIMWAYKEGITSGYAMKNGTKQFKPKSKVRRDHMAVFLFNASDDKKPSVKKKPFKDVSTKYAYSKEIQWMKNTGLSTGSKHGNYMSKSNTTRGQMAAFMDRWIDHSIYPNMATFKEQKDWTASLPPACKDIEIRDISITNPTKKGASFSASVKYDGNGVMYYTLKVNGNLKPGSAAGKALMKHECGHVLMGIYSDNKGRSNFRSQLDRGWKSSDSMRVEKAADCIADQLGAVRQTSSYKVGYGTKCSTTQKNVAKTITNYSKNR